MTTLPPPPMELVYTGTTIHRHKDIGSVNPHNYHEHMAGLAKDLDMLRLRGDESVIAMVRDLCAFDAKNEKRLRAEIAAEAEILAKAKSAETKAKKSAPMKIEVKKGVPKVIARKLCRICGEEFQPYSSRVVMCSLACRDEDDRRSKRKAWGKQAGGNRLQCSSCSAVLANRRSSLCKPCRAERDRKYNREYSKEQIASCTCVVCGSAFANKGNAKKTCSKACYVELASRNSKAQQAAKGVAK